MFYRQASKFAVIFIVLVLALSSVPSIQSQENRQAAVLYVGSRVLLQGQVMDTAGVPVQGAVVEIWQADINGNYNHPAASDPSLLLEDFQYFGTATTNEVGEYAFLTLKPGPPPAQLPRISFRVHRDGLMLLASQFYFVEDSGAIDDTLFLLTASNVDADLADDGIRMATGNIVLDLNGGDSDILTPTAPQTEDPFYPAVSTSGYDNNLLSTSQNDEIVHPVHQAGEFPIGNDLTIEALRQREITGSEITFEQTLANGNGYAQYIASYISEGNKIYGLLTVPLGDPPPGGFKAIVFNHGYIPPDSYVTTERYVAYVATLASHGFVVFKIDLRGHGNSEGEATGSYYSIGYTIDAIAALKSLQTLDFVDPQGIGMWGHSMAGNLVLRAMLVEPDIQAGVIWAGAVYSYDDFVQYRISDPSRPAAGQSPSRRRSRALITLYGEPTTAHPYWQAVSLTEHIDYLQSPLQIHHAVDDTVVNIGYSSDLSQVLTEHNKLFEFHSYAGGGHNINSPYFEQAIMRTVIFFQQHL